MNIVVLDGYALNPGDLSWASLEALGDCQVYNRTSPDQVRERLGEAEIALVNKVALGRDTLRALPRLRYLGVTATGYNGIDMATAEEQGIVVTNVPDYGTSSVAQATLALLLELTNAVGHHSCRVRAGDWSHQPDWCFWDGSLIELAGLTAGIIGYGRIGRAFARLVEALGMTVLIHSPHPTPLPPGRRAVPLDRLLAESDVVSLHCPLNDQTRQLLNAVRLSAMKSGAWLLNTSRGELVDEPALADALNRGHLAGAGLDVLSLEPPGPDHPLLQARHCLITPHLAWASQAARSRLIKASVQNVEDFLKGSPRNQVTYLPPTS